MLVLAAEALGGPGMEKGLTWSEVSKKLGVNEEVLIKEVVGEKNEVEAVDGRLKIWTRARHVVSFFSLSFDSRESNFPVCKK